MLFNGLPGEVYYQVVEQSAIATSITDVDANIIYANSAFCRVTGYSLKEVIGQNQSFLSDKTTPKVVYKALWSRLQQNKNWSGVLVNRRKNGGRYLADLTIVPVLDEHQTVTHYLGMHRDVTEMHELEQRTRNQKTLIESVINLAPMAIAVLSGEGKVELDNLEYKALMADSRSDEPAQWILEQLGIQYSGDQNSAARDFSNREVCFDMGGSKRERWFSCSGTWFQENDGRAESFFEQRNERHLLLIAHDITALKDQEQSVRSSAMRAILAKEQLVQSLREVLSGAAFKLQGPLNMMGAVVHMLKQREDRGGCSISMVEALDQALDAGRETVANLEASRPADPEESVVAVNFNTLLDDVLAVSRERIQALSVAIDYIPDADLPCIQGQPTKLTTALKQLLDNALDAVEAADAEYREIRVRTEFDDDMIKLHICDSGVGIPDSSRRQVFEPFFTTKTGEGAAGMGLPTSQNVITNHGGLIWMENSLLGGICVRLQFPIPAAEKGALL